MAIQSIQQGRDKGNWSGGGLSTYVHLSLWSLMKNKKVKLGKRINVIGALPKSKANRVLGQRLRAKRPILDIEPYFFTKVYIPKTALPEVQCSTIGCDSMCTFGLKARTGRHELYYCPADLVNTHK